MKKSILILATLALLSACNTMRGMGQDIGAAGDAITGTAKKTQDKM